VKIASGTPKTPVRVDSGERKGEKIMGESSVGDVDGEDHGFRTNLRVSVFFIICGRREILVRDGKGMKDRVTMLPDALILPLKEHVAKRCLLYKGQYSGTDPEVSPQIHTTWQAFQAC
jgi:hypothetical protein